MTIADWAGILAVVALFFVIVPLGGYWLVLRCVRFFVGSRPYRTGFREPVTIVIAAYNEEANIGRCLTSLTAHTFESCIQRIVIADDGSSDGTVDVARRFAESQKTIDVVILENGRRGKNATLSLAFEHVDTSVAILTDADIIFQPGTIDRLIDPMADETIGIVVGKTVRPKLHGDGGSEGEAIHQTVIALTAELESQLASTVLSNGHAYAVRRSLLVTYPDNAVADDLYLNLLAIRRGYRVVFASQACVHEIRENTLLSEFERTKRTLSSGLKAILRNAAVLQALHRPEGWFLLGHRISRWVSPFALIILVVALALLAPTSSIAYAGLISIVSLLVLGIVGAILETRHTSVWLLRFPAYYVMMNLAAASALVAVLFGGGFDQWRPSSAPMREKGR